LLDKPNVKRKKYSFTEYIWLKIVEQLRLAGFPIAQIHELQKRILEPIQVKGLVTLIDKAKNYIDELKISEKEKNNLREFLAANEKSNAKELGDFNLLHIIIMESILKKLPLSLAVFTDNTFVILDKGKEHLYSEQEKNRLLYETHIVVSVTSIIQKFFLSDISGWVVPEINLLSAEENKLFSLLHSGNYESIIVKFRDKKIKTMELMKSEGTKEKVIDILRAGEFSEIVIQKRKGETVKIENTLKIVL
jgi:DNA-binding transcriptional MerR regulator